MADKGLFYYYYYILFLAGVNDTDLFFGLSIAPRLGTIGALANVTTTFGKKQMTSFLAPNN